MVGRDTGHEVRVDTGGMSSSLDKLTCTWTVMFVSNYKPLSHLSFLEITLELLEVFVNLLPVS